MQKLTDLADTTLAAQDHAQQQSPGDLPTIFRAAMDDSPIPGSQMQLEVAQLAKAPGKVTKYEYVQFRIYRERDKNVRKEFISEWLQWPIEKICGDPEWGPVTTDKLACATFLQGRGVPTIPVLAVVNPAKDVEVPAINN